MSQHELSALIAKFQADAGLRKRLQAASDMDAVVQLAKEVGVDLSQADWLRLKAMGVMELSDEQLEGAAGGQGQLSMEVMDIEQCGSWCPKENDVISCR